MFERVRAASEHFGAELALRVRDDASAILLVDYQPTTLRLQRPGGINEDQFSLDVWYFMAGGQVEIVDRGAVVPHATGTLGVAWFNPTDGSGQRDSETMFAGTFGGGARVPLGQSQKVSLRLEGRVASPFRGVVPVSIAVADRGATGVLEAPSDPCRARSWPGSGSLWGRVPDSSRRVGLRLSRTLSGP